MAEDSYNLPKIEIRNYQQKGIDKIYDAWESGKRRVMFQMPTGTGKTVVFNQIVKQELEQNSTVLILAHRQELIEQNLRRLREDFQIEAGMIMGDKPVNLALAVQVASIQTLSRRDYPSLNPSLIIIDEAHHVRAKSYIKLLEEYPESRILGVTASPIRLSGEGFTDSFDILITSKSIAEFIQDGYLAPIKYWGRSKTFSKVDLSNVSIVEGDYDPNELSQKMRDEIVMANLIQNYINHANGKKMIVFAVDVEHSKDITQRYKDEGFVAAHLDAKTGDTERKRIINKFRTGEIQILSNVGIVSEGFDVPDCEVVQLARPTKSLAMYLQQVGRCMRKPEGKQYCIVLDNVGLYEEFGSPRKPRTWTLGVTSHAPPDSDSSSNSRESDPPSRTKPEETDEDLIMLEDFDMPIENETISKQLSEIDTELKKLEENTTGDSNISSSIEALRTLKDSIDRFLSLPCYDLLVNVPNPLSISHFVESKDNTLKLAGKSELFLSCDFFADFTLPQKFDKPMKPDKPDPYIGEARMAYLEALSVCFEWEDSEESKINFVIDKLTEAITNLDIVRKYDNLRRVVEFVKKQKRQDPDIFVVPIWEQEQVSKLSELPRKVRTIILESHQKALEYAPYIQKDGNKIMININHCNFTSIEGITSLITFMAQHRADKRTMPFWNFAIFKTIHEVKNLVNAADLYFIISKFDSKIGSSNNVTQTTRNFSQLF